MPLKNIFTIRVVGFAVLGSALVGCTANISNHPPPPESRKMADPVWNVWAEGSSKISFSPESLRPGRDYTLVVNLGALHYRDLEGKAVYSQDSSASFNEFLKRHPNENSADVDLLVVPDQRYFQVVGKRSTSMNVDLSKIRQAQAGFPLDGSPFEYLRKNHGEAPFSFGLKTFKLRTNANAKPGNAPVAISIWAEGRPIDEVSVNLCVTDKEQGSCDTSAAGDYTLKGVDLSGKGTLPDAALHLIERGTDIVGVFRCNACPHPDYKAWSLGQQEDGWLAKQTNGVVQQLTPPVRPEQFSIAGDTLFNLIFPNSEDPNEVAAEQAFVSFFSAANAKKDGDAPLSLFVRLLPNKPTLVLFPMALMRVPLSNGNKEFLGFKVNVEAPLELQDYSKPDKCIADWVLFAPPAAGQDLGDLADAREYASKWIDAFGKSCAKCVHSDPDEFSNWLLESTQIAPAEHTQALIILSQYKDNSLFFNGVAEHPPSVLSSSIRRRFGVPSFAILDACGTAAPGGSEFIRMLNAHGVYSIISTSTAIPGSLGGQFLTLFMETLSKHPDYSTSRARFETVKALSKLHDSDDKPFGAQTLVFTLVGNGSLRLCIPK